MVTGKLDVREVAAALPDEWSAGEPQPPEEEDLSSGEESESETDPDAATQSREDESDV